MPEAPTLGELEAESAADSMRAVLGEMGKTDDDAASEMLGNEADVTADAPETEAPVDEPKDDGRDRDEKGRFVAKDKGEESPTEESETEERPEAELSGEVVEPESDDDPLEPLPEWTAEQHEEFRKLPRAAQQFLLDNVSAAAAKAEEANQGATKYTAIEELLAPRRAAFARDGLDDAGALRQLFALSDFAAQDAAGFARWFIQNRGIHPDQIFGQSHPNQEDHQFADDPLYQRMVQENAAILQQLDNLSGMIQNQQTSAQKQASQQVLSQIEAFRQATDDKGRPVHPYFEQVEPLMIEMIAAQKRRGQSPDLQSAYDMACRADPDVHAKIAAAERAQAEREAQRQRRAKAEAASNAGKSISGSPGERAAPEPSGDIREDMRRQFVERGIELPTV